LEKYFNVIGKLEDCIAPETTLDATAEIRDGLSKRVRPIRAHHIQSQQSGEQCTPYLFATEKQKYSQEQIETSQQIINPRSLKTDQQDARHGSHEEYDDPFPSIPAHRQDEEQG
jgi:hypothetical protein